MLVQANIARTKNGILSQQLGNSEPRASASGKLPRAARFHPLCLFIPTVDMLATYQINVFLFSISCGVASFIFPAIYPLSDSITEVYGQKTSLYLTMVSYLVIISGSLINNLLLSSSSNHHLYDFLVKSSLSVTIMGPIAYITTSYINIKLISRLKLKMRGKHFMIRSFICSGLSESITSLIVLPVVFYDKGANYIISIYLGTVFIKVLVTIPFVFVARILVLLCKQVDGKSSKQYNQEFISMDICKAT